MTIQYHHVISLCRLCKSIAVLILLVIIGDIAVVEYGIKFKRAKKRVNYILFTKKYA